MDEFKRKMESISPESVLKKATPERSDIEGGRRRLNENVFDGLVKDVIKKMKK